MKKTTKTVSMIRVFACQAKCMAKWAQLQGKAQTALCEGAPHSFADSILDMADRWMDAYHILDGIQFGNTDAMVVDMPAWENRPTYPQFEDC